ncbi:hypothetical protein [Rariglobus hedericola]|uniref:Uncharacterized protein n=1 Tax=Rariglobus hedericola TaxID=2597822 RepID=A0A556QEN5_9BACT|nr:hypothetical protein [Rariglobus hedericola]TSJ75098.1 hypothetical protein FPL22_17020 [Rariglobus hedericola]
MLAIEVSRAAQPLIETAGDPDAPDEDSGEVTQANMAAVEVAAIAAAAATAGQTGAPSFDEDGPVWPDESAESAIRAEVVERGETLSSKAARELSEAAAEAAAEKKNLPSLDALVAKIPADVRETLEDLFRVKFVKVARAPKKSLKE